MMQAVALLIRWIKARISVPICRPRRRDRLDAEALAMPLHDGRRLERRRRERAAGTVAAELCVPKTSSGLI
jgi:hypothetical protein